MTFTTALFVIGKKVNEQFNMTKLKTIGWNYVNYFAKAMLNEKKECIYIISLHSS